MKASERGSKHICPKCACKYYDLGNETVTCPSCGAKPPVAKLARSVPSAKRSGRSTFGRYP
jgi:uncharacterized protein (TIGR02300 family)